jgi:hypothetical protein
MGPTMRDFLVAISIFAAMLLSISVIDHFLDPDDS